MKRLEPYNLILWLLLAAIPVSVQARHSYGKWSRCAFLFKDTGKAQSFLIKNFDTLHFQNGERIADIGAKGGNLEGVLSLFYQNLNFTVEDIDSGCLNTAQMESVFQYYTGLNGRQPSGISYKIIIGNDSATTLPSAGYQKVFLLNTWHEITKQAAMIQELYRITAPGGMLYVQETVAEHKHIYRRDCHHLMPLDAEIFLAFTHAGFRMIKKNVVKSHRQKGDRVKVCCYHFLKP